MFDMKSYMSQHHHRRQEMEKTINNNIIMYFNVYVDYLCACNLCDLVLLCVGVKSCVTVNRTLFEEFFRDNMIDLPSLFIHLNE